MPIKCARRVSLSFQEKMIDLESDVEEMHDSEQRWAVKSKRSIEQVRVPPRVEFPIDPYLIRIRVGIRILNRISPSGCRMNSSS